MLAVKVLEVTVTVPAWMAPPMPPMRLVDVLAVKVLEVTVAVLASIAPPASAESVVLPVNEAALASTLSPTTALPSESLNEIPLTSTSPKVPPPRSSLVNSSTLSRPSKVTESAPAPTSCRSFSLRLRVSSMRYSPSQM